MLKAYDLNISNSLKSLGKTFLGNTNIAGDLTVDGTLSIENGNEINVIGSCQPPAISPQTNTNQSDDRRLTTDDCTGILYLQSSPLAQGLDIFNGKVTIDSSGNIQTQGTVTAKEVVTNKLTIKNASPSATLAASIGTAKIPAGKISVEISSSSVTINSKIFITPNKPVLIAVSQKTPSHTPLLLK